MLNRTLEQADYIKAEELPKRYNRSSVSFRTLKRRCRLWGRVWWQETFSYVWRCDV